MASFIKKIFGNKYDRDMKAITPTFEKVKTAYKGIFILSNDQLREKTIEFRRKIKEYISEEENKINELKSIIDTEQDIEKKEKLYEDIDKLEKEAYNKTQEIIHKTILTQGIFEADLSEILTDWEANLKKNNIKLAYLPTFDIVRLRLSIKGKNRDKLNKKIKTGLFLTGYTG